MRSAGRAQSETLGFVLVFSIMLLGALLVVGLGANALSDTEERIHEDRAEQTLTQLDAKAALVALGEADSQRIEFGRNQDGNFHVREDDGWMQLTVENLTDGNTEEVMNVTLGAITYEGSGSSIAYQGGGVWRATDEGGQMISPPEFHYRNGTLTLPAITVSGDFDLRSYAEITQGVATKQFPQDGPGSFGNPLDNHLVTVTVGSQYYRGWGHYFEKRTDGEVEYDDQNQTVEVTLVSPVDDTSVTTAAASLTAAGDFLVQGNPASTCGGSVDRYSDSYNSSLEKPYCDQLSDGDTGNEGDIIYGGNIELSGAGGSDFCGDLVAGGSVIAHATGNNDGDTCGQGQGGQPTIYGHINYTDSCVDCKDAIADIDEGYSVNRISGLETMATIDWHIDNMLEEISGHSAVEEPGALSDGQILDAGVYNFSSFEVGANDRVELDTSDGDVEIAVWENVVLNENAVVNVSGDNEVLIYVGGHGAVGSDDLEMAENAEITNANDNGTKLRVYGKADFQATIGDGNSNLAKFVGVIFAPPGTRGDGTVDIDGGELFGGLVTGTTTIPSGPGGSIHYDEALREQSIIDPSARVIRLTFLHVTVNEIQVNS